MIATYQNSSDIVANFGPKKKDEIQKRVRVSKPFPNIIGNVIKSTERHTVNIQITNSVRRYLVNFVCNSLHICLVTLITILFFIVQSFLDYQK